MANNHKQEGVNIYSKEFKSKLRELVSEENFKREILFNGVCREYSLLSYEEQEKLSRKFSSWVNENIISCMNEEVEFILSCDDRTGDQRLYNNLPFSWEDVDNEFYFDIERATDDILNAFESYTYNDIDDDEEFKDIEEDDQEQILEFLEIMNIEDEEIQTCSYGFLYDLVKEKLDDMDEDEIKDFLDNNYNLLGLCTSEYEEHAEVYQWFLVSGYLCELLNEYGEVTINSNNYWGRTCCGQSIELDGVIQNIFLDVWTREF